MEITKKILEKLIFEEHMTDMDIANHFDVQKLIMLIFI